MVVPCWCRFQVSVWSLHMSACSCLGFHWILPQSKDMHAGLTGDSKFAKGVSLHGFLSLCDEWVLSKKHTTSCPIFPGTGF